MKVLILRILHTIRSSSCSFTAINVDPISGKRKIMCVSCGKSKKAFYVR